MTIRSKNITGYSVILLLMVAVAVIGVVRVQQISAGLTQINDVNAVKQRYAINFRGSVHDRSIDIRDVVLIQDDQALLDSVLENIGRLEEFYRDSEVAMDEIFATDDTITDEEHAALSDIRDVKAQTEPVVTEIIELRSANRLSEAQDILLTEARPLFTEWLRVINVFIDLQERMNQEIAARTRAIAEGFAFLIAAATAIAFAVGAVLSLWVVRSLNPLRDVARALKEISEGDGDLTMTIENTRADEVGQVASEFNGFVANLRGIIGSVRESVDRLAASSNSLVTNISHTTTAIRELNAGIAEVRTRVVDTQAPEVDGISSTIEEITGNIKSLSAVIERQSETIQNSTAAVEEMIANVASVTQNLQRSSERFDYLHRVADGGSDRIREVNEMIASIAEQSQGMLQANSVIGNVAAQTNLLAMNAAIEAAHAGDAGRGFAVVADEIRALAEDSSRQSKSISSVLRELQRSIEAVVAKSGEAGEAFGSVQEAIDTVVSFQREIQAAMDEQTTGNQQVLQSFERINELTSQVRHGSQEMTTGSRIILEKIQGLVGTTREIEEQVAAMSHNTGEIEQAVAAVERVTAETGEEVETVKSGVGRFRIE